MADAVVIDPSILANLKYVLPVEDEELVKGMLTLKLIFTHIYKSYNVYR
jgi:hypothetical protein